MKAEPAANYTLPEEETVARIPLREGRELRVRTFLDFHGTPSTDVRVFLERKTQSRWQAQKGVTFPTARVSEVIGALQELDPS